MSPSTPATCNLYPTSPALNGHGQGICIRTCWRRLLCWWTRISILVIKIGLFSRPECPDPMFRIQADKEVSQPIVSPNRHLTLTSKVGFRFSCARTKCVKCGEEYKKSENRSRYHDGTLKILQYAWTKMNQDHYYFLFPEELKGLSEMETKPQSTVVSAVPSILAIIKLL